MFLDLSDVVLNEHYLQDRIKEKKEREQFERLEHRRRMIEACEARQYSRIIKYPKKRLMRRVVKRGAKRRVRYIPYPREVKLVITHWYRQSADAYRFILYDHLMQNEMASIIALFADTPRFPSEPFLIDLAIGTSYVFSNDGRRLFNVHRNVIHEFDLTQNKLIKRWKSKHHTIKRLAFNSPMLAFDSASGEVFVWDVDLSRLIYRFDSGRNIDTGDCTTVMEFDETGTRLIAGFEDQTLHVWSMRNGTRLGCIQHSCYMRSVFAIQDSILVCSENGIWEWNVTGNGDFLQRLEIDNDEFQNPRYSINHCRTLIAIWDRRVLVILTLPDFRVKWRRRVLILWFGFQPRSNLVALFDGERMTWIDLSSEKVVRRIGFDRWHGMPHFTPDGTGLLRGDFFSLVWSEDRARQFFFSNNN